MNATVIFLQSLSEHPLGSAIVAACTAPLSTATNVRATAGRGVTGTVDGKSVEVSIEGVAEGAPASATLAFISIDGVASGWLAIADPIRETARPALLALKNAGVEVVLLSGDRVSAVEAVARELGIAEFHGGMTPAKKAELIQAMKANGAHVVAMAGDGINDSPALAAANVGIAMGTGTGAAIETAGVTLLHGDLKGIEQAIRLSKETMKNIRQNLFFAFAYNFAGVPLAAGVLYPVFGLLLSPMIAAAAMMFSSVSVISNALRLRRLKL